MKIGIQNFRVFKERQDFDIKPITLLTGPNNSGKSAFTKLLELLKLGVDNLNLKNGRHNLNSFENAVNWGSLINEFVITFPSSVEFISNNLETEITFREEKVCKMLVKDKEVTLLKSERLFDMQNKNNTYFYFNYKYIIDLFVQGENFIKIDWQNNDFTYRKMNQIVDYDTRISFDNYNDFFVIEDSSINLSKDHNIFEANVFGTHLVFKPLDNNYFSSVYLIKHFFDNIDYEKRYLLYDMYVNGVDVTERFSEILQECQDFVFNGIDLDLFGFTNNTSMKIFIEGCLMKSFMIIRDKLKEELISKYLIHDNDDIVLEPNDMHRLFFKECFVNWVLFDNKGGKTFFNQFANQIEDFEASLERVDFISAQRGNINRVILNSDQSDMNRIFLEYKKKKESTNKVFEKFIKDAFSIFDINGDLHIETFEDTIIKPLINIEGKLFSFADLGFGFSQIIPIIVKIAILEGSMHKFTNKNNICIVEEPESNLHPNFQSKLADLFVLAINTFPNIRFIIETHSEYLIRKLQYLTAKNEVDHNLIHIYYFNEEKYVCETEPKVKEIKLNKNGSLTDDFGPGFFDESLKLKFELIKLNSEQLN